MQQETHFQCHLSQHRKQNPDLHFGNEILHRKKFTTNTKRIVNGQGLGGGGRGGTPYINHIGISCPKSLRVLIGPTGNFGLRIAIHFAYFGLESGMVFEGVTGVYERIYRFDSK